MTIIFGQYKVADKDYSGNRMTAVPQWVWTNSVKIDFPYQLNLNLYHNFTSSMPLDDANSIYAKKFHLVQAKLSYTAPCFYGVSVQVYAGVDNALNQRYSLGNDINAFGGRYFNAAATRNFYGGLKLIF